MFKYFKGDLLIFTNRGLVRIDNIKKTDLILAVNKNGSFYYEEIDEIEKVYKKKYVLNKVNFHNSIDSYFINDNIEIKAIQNIPLNIDFNELPNYLNYNNCYNNSKIEDLSTFDYIGFPTNIIFNDENKKDNHFYRYQGLLLGLGNISTYIFDKEKNNETIDFITAYLKDNNFNYELFETKNTTKINIDTNPSIQLSDLFKLNKEQLLILAKGIIEINNYLIINNKQLYYIIKYIFLLLGISIISYYKDGFIHIKISRKLLTNHYNFVNHNNLIWNKIKSIKKINYNGFLYSLKLKTNNYYITDIGVIS